MSFRELEQTSHVTGKDGNLYLQRGAQPLAMIVPMANIYRTEEDKMDDLIQRELIRSEMENQIIRELTKRGKD